MNEPHVCICDDCNPAPYDDVCQYQQLLDQARADVLKFRDFTDSLGDYLDFEDGVKLMADTEHYEHYRAAPQGGGTR